MKIDYAAEPLDSPEAWTRLGEALDSENCEAVQNTIRHLRVLDVKSYLIEDPYIDRDYSADYLEFYARTFRTYERHCKRVHFFSIDVSSVLKWPLTTEGLRKFQAAAGKAYCGFSVVRPLPTAPVGRTVLTARISEGFDREGTITCRAGYKVNLLGIELEVTGAAFLQQDARVGACAQVAIWTGIRHMHARHNYDWVSVADLTRLARPRTAHEGMSLPAGSDFLTSERMIRAISEAGYQALCFRGPLIDREILPYVESGIPVILGLRIGGGLGHAVTVIGRVLARQQHASQQAVDYVPAYIVHDDQSGPYRLLPMDKTASTTYSFADDTIKRDATGTGVTEFNVRQHANFAVALMSPRVFSTAAAAEVSARDRIDEALHGMPTTRALLKKWGHPVNERLLDDLQAAHSADEVVLRTYLTSAAGYRRYLLGGTACDDLKDALLDLHLPHFTWITEISTTDSYNHSSRGMRRIFGHTVLDATSTGKDGDGLLVLHLPGLLFTKDIDDREEPVQLDIIKDDALYECREKRL